MPHIPCVLADLPLHADVIELAGAQIRWLDCDSTAAEKQSVEGIYTFGHPRVDEALLAACPGVRVVSNYGVGVDHIDVAAATRRGIPVGNTPGILDGATADMGFALLLASARRIVEGDAYARSPEFTRYDAGYLLGVEVHGQTLGIVGLGRIGSQVARRAKGFDMRVLYYNRNPRPEAEAALGVAYRSLDELLAQSDYVMLTCPLSDASRGLIDRHALAKMKRTATLVNLARGAVVNTQDLYEALAGGVIARAALDVTDPEPLPRDHPLLKLPNLTIAPHLGSATQQTRRKMAELSIENLLLGLAGQPLKHRVN